MVAMNAAITQKLSGLGSNVLKGHFIFNREVDETALKRQFGQVAKFPRGLNLAFSKNPQDLEVYYNIRERAYREDLHFKNFSGKEELDDIRGNILIVKSGSTVVGGARLTVSSPENRATLPMECDDFSVAKVCPQIDFSVLSYCEMSRLALLPEFRTGLVMEELSKVMLNFCLENDVKLGFAIAINIHARRFQRIFSQLGYGYLIFEDTVIKKKAFDYIDALFCAADFTRDQSYVSRLEEAKSIKTTFEELEEYVNDLEVQPA